jgi:atypical dual specificity phosphatase
MCNFAPVAPDASVYGVCRPGHLGGGLEEWTATVADAGVDRVVCLLSSTEATRWGLPEAYADRFETAHVPICDRQLPENATLRTALRALRDAEAAGESVVLHCNAGLGRTGVVAAAWLTRERGYDPQAAVETVAEAGRAPREAVRCGNATEAELLELLTP